MSVPEVTSPVSTIATTRGHIAAGPVNAASRLDTRDSDAGDMSGLDYQSPFLYESRTQGASSPRTATIPSRLSAGRPRMLGNHFSRFADGSTASPHGQSVIPPEARVDCVI
jgi:hypothetical protein